MNKVYDVKVIGWVQVEVSANASEGDVHEKIESVLNSGSVMSVLRQKSLETYKRGSDTCCVVLPDCSEGVHLCEASPTGHCCYNDLEDRDHDCCLFCGEPHERK